MLGEEDAGRTTWMIHPEKNGPSFQWRRKSISAELFSCLRLFTWQCDKEDPFLLSCMRESFLQSSCAAHCQTRAPLLWGRWLCTCVAPQFDLWLQWGFLEMSPGCYRTDLSACTPLFHWGNNQKWDRDSRVFFCLAVTLTMFAFLPMH